MTPAPATRLPEPASERWKPLRAGLVDIFYYDAEEFWFHDGRLLLRGNNGTGKSKVLALTLPFLLDGELAPHRVEPDGDRQKRMEWNLLLGGRHPHPERLGYTWLEFGRRAADGTAEFRTIGCGLKAVTGRGISRHWFFVTGQRPGLDVHLVSATGVALTREKLREAVDGHGMVYDRASDYRRAVDEALFGLGEHRYEALVNLLIQLRQPQLSKRPDERLLSRALTEALPPLSPTLIATVAEAFRGLDEEREALRSLEEARTAAEAFLGHYRRYARIAAKRAAAGPRLTHSRYEHLNRDLTEAESRHDAAERELSEATRLLEELRAEKTRLEGRRQALEASPQMRDAKRIEEMGRELRRRAEHAERLERERADRVTETDRRRGRAEAARTRREQAQHALATALDRAGAAAARARCGGPHDEIVSGWEHDPARARREADDLVERTSRAIAELERLLAVLARARTRLESARVEAERLERQIQDAAERVEAADTLTRSRSAELLDAYVTYLARLEEIKVGDPDAVLAALEAWTQTAEGANPAATAVNDAARAATAELGRLDAALDSRLRAERETANRLEEEIGKLERGVHEPPPVPHTRDQQARADRPGAPLWRVVDFSDALPAEHRAGLEASLEAAGILDAWVTPEGGLLAADDTFLLAGDPVDGPSCATVLRPAVDRADPRAAVLGDDAVAAVLKRIGLGPGARTWVAVDGRWANGVLGGSWHKDEAGYIGEGAREAARRARIARLRAELGETAGRVAALEDEREVLSARQRALDAEHRALPPDTDLREAHVRFADAVRRRRELTDEHTEALGVVAERDAEAAAAHRHAAEFADDVGLPVDGAELAEIGAAMTDYRLALAGLWPAAESLRTARRAENEETEELGRVQDRLNEVAERAAEARAEATEADETYRALVETAGAAVEELFRQLEEVREALTARDGAETGARRRERAALEARGEARGACERLADEIRQAAGERDAAMAAFRGFAATGLLAVALPELEIPDPDQEWAVRPAVELARAVNAALDGVDDADGPWDRVQRRVTEEHKQLSDVMSRHGHSVGLTLRDGIMVVDVVFQGRTRDIPGLAGALAEDTGHRARLLSAREREILENHLLNEVAGTLQELIAAAEEEVAAMNTELTARPTSTGMRLRLLWRPARDAPEGLERVREKLRQTVDAWSAGDRAAVGAFLQEQINREHADNPAAGWTEQLTKALDYRNWHAFSIQRLQDGQWRPATGPASGGERVLAASVPLFAAASAHYKSAANPHAPRLVALDEAFAGVDDDSRAKCLGLLATFDMDVVMTSEREWGCYPQVPGLGICQLSRRDGIDAVLVTPWRWDGRELTRAARPDPLRAPGPEPDAVQEDLFTERPET
ncbi:TIGR02680 family protein [Actinomadura sp. NPDC047616]|uniref:TIGR02680 family protein n=1 Tax=Actinomadura sp. NPDC047616 TaxID=3155914 RepID=UPI0033EAC30E